MKPVFYSAPITLPRPANESDRDVRTGMAQFCRRAMELWRAASLISETEPGLLNASELENARRRGLAAGKRVLADCPGGKARIAYLRSLTGDGIHADASTISSLANRIWLLEDQYGLADSYLRAVSDTALQYGAECILCPSPLRRNRLEAVFLPGCNAAFLSMNAVGKASDVSGRRVHLDRIPDSERKQALRSTLKENRQWVEALTNRAAGCLKNAEILRDLKADSCAVTPQRL